MKDKVQVSFYVNGTRRELNVKPYWNLLRALREELGITSVREGCSEGECGACTVLLNGEAVSSCLVLASSLNQDDQVTTLEGIGDNGALHPLQESFHNHGAAQCGFCTPGIILSSKSLLDQNPEPSREEISEAISGNLCRCTGYVKPIEAIYSTSRGSVAPHEPDEGAGREESGFSVVGKSALRVDGEDLVTARTRYVDDMAFPNMLHAKALLSKHHHALIRKLDVSKAESLPGVAAVLTAKDVPNNMYGGGIKDQPCLCEDRVRHLGDIVAVVAAEDPDIAEEAVKLIEVEYEELPAVFDPMEAMEPDAVQIHPHGNFVPGPAGPNKNRWQVRKGDVEAGLKEADLIIEDTFTTPMCEHVHIEPHVA
ncbi:MAG: 2Fe-2S iron-sulfur cluster-binding protein, partial [Pseudomonadota bacterium]